MSVYGRVLKFKRKYPLTIAFRLRKHARVVENILDPDEKVYYAFCGQRNDEQRFLFDSCVVAFTNKRIIVGEKRALFGYYLITISTKLFNDLSINVGMIFGRIVIDTVKEKLYISNVDKRAMDEIETKVHDIITHNNCDLKKEEEERTKKK